MVLTFQSSYMPDGMMEFIGMLRGWMVIQTNVVPSLEDSCFHRFTEDAFVESMRSLLGDEAAEAAAADDEDLHGVLQDFTVSLRLVAPLCQSVAELKYLSAMEGVAHLAKSSPVDGGFSDDHLEASLLLTLMAKHASSSCRSTP